MNDSLYAIQVSRLLDFPEKLGPIFESTLRDSLMRNSEGVDIRLQLNHPDYFENVVFIKVEVTDPWLAEHVKMQIHRQVDLTVRHFKGEIR